MRRNVAGQKVGAQVLTTAGAAFTGAVTVHITLDGGTQATGSVGAGAATHEGNGYHTYAPAQAETDGDLVAVTFTGTGASPVTMSYETQVHTLIASATSGIVEIYNIVNNLVGADSTLSVATMKLIADYFLGRSIVGGADGGRTVSQALMHLRNKSTLSGSAGDLSRTLTVYANDGSTILFQATITFDSGGAITGFTPST